LITTHGAVSAEVARAMAEGALQRSHAQLTIAVTGIAGPGGASPGKPVGTVWLAVARAGHAQAELLTLSGDRTAVREQTVRHALQRLLESA
jgi:nicotinamide-nucleotide amidase